MRVAKLIRYEPRIVLAEEGHGDYVLYESHLASVAHLVSLLRRIQKDGYDPLWRIAEDVAETIGSQSNPRDVT